MGETEFTCVWCGKRIKGVENLRNHVLTEHRDRVEALSAKVKEARKELEKR